LDVEAAIVALKDENVDCLNKLKTYQDLAKQFDALIKAASKCIDGFDDTPEGKRQKFELQRQAALEERAAQEAKIAEEKRVAETATTASIHRTGENSVLASIAMAISAISVPASGPMIWAPSSLSVLASASSFTKPSMSPIARARPLAVNGNFPTL
jgi:hypothetical protein